MQIRDYLVKINLLKITVLNRRSYFYFAVANSK